MKTHSLEEMMNLMIQTWERDRHGLDDQVDGAFWRGAIHGMKAMQRLVLSHIEEKI